MMYKTERGTAIHICGGETFEPSSGYCPFCDEETDGIFREVFGGYGYDSVCGFCGTWIWSGEYVANVSQSERRRNIALVERIRNSTSIMETVESLENDVKTKP